MFKEKENDNVKLYYGYEKFYKYYRKDSLKISITKKVIYNFFIKYI
ncbi:hypothetical protein UT300001_24780 [Clostridium sp. CTA-1]